MTLILDYQPIYHEHSSFFNRWLCTVIACVLLLSVLSIKVWIKLESIQLGYELAGQREETVRLDMQRRDLELQRSILLRPDVLRSRAAKELGLRELNLSHA